MLREQLEQLERISRQLDWTGHEATTKFAEACDFACAFVDGIDSAPAWHGNPSENNAPFKALADGSTELAEVLQDYTRLALENGINTTSGRFFGYVPGGGIATAAIGDLLAGVTNPYAGMYLASPGAVDIENQVVDWIRCWMGMPQGTWGTLQSGGTLATLTALVAARDTRPVARWPRGVIYSSAQVHGCLGKALTIAGMANITRRTVATDNKHRMRLDDLETCIAEDRRRGLEPWIVVASAGTVNTGAVDPLQSIAEVCAKESLWFHVDGAYGGFFNLTELGAERLAGIARADSLVLDPHKGLFQRYGCGAVLVRDGARLRQSMTYKADYLADVESEHPSPADYSPELTRHFRGLGLWLSLRVHGLERYRAALQEKLLLAQYAYAQLSTVAGLEMGETPQLSTLTFRVAGTPTDTDTDTDADRMTSDLLTQILHRGRIHLSSTRLGKRLWLRLCVLSFRSHRADIDTAVQEIRRALSQR